MFEYQINVAKDGKHIFRTDIINDKAQAEHAYRLICVTMPASEGFDVTCSKRSLVRYSELFQD